LGNHFSGSFYRGLCPAFAEAGKSREPGHLCVACFERDSAGALGLHRAAVVQYIRPEIIGFVLGSLIVAYAFGEFRPPAGSALIVRFVLGAFAMIGALAWPVLQME
jgi:YedE family putative selenium metabolism protein